MLREWLRRVTSDPVVTEPKPCEWCRVVMAPQRAVVDHGRVFCSEQHADNYWHERQW